MKFVFWGGVAVAAYGILTFVLAAVQGLNPTHVQVHGVLLPFFDPTTTATVLLALGTAALAYSALRQAVASETLLDFARGQERATAALADAAKLQAQTMEKQRQVLESQLELTRSQARAARSDAERAEAIRRATSFPRLHVVTVSSNVDRRPAGVIPGNAYPEWGNPILGVENLGNGQASDLRIVVSWKVYDFELAKTAGGEQLRAIPWEAVPQWVPPHALLGPREVDWVETTGWLSKFVVGSQQTKRIVALYLKASWTDPDGVRRSGVVGGLVLVVGSFIKAPDAMGTEYATFEAVETDDAPREDQFSSEAPLPRPSEPASP